MAFATGTTLEVDGVRTALHGVGSGPALLLAHGSGPGVDAPMSWWTILEDLAADHRVLAVDMPGYGRSDMLSEGDTPVNVAGHLWKLLDQLGVDQVGLIGHSRGGRIVCEMAVTAPERVAHLAILASGSVAPGGHVNADGSFTAPALELVWWGQDGDTSYERFAKALRTQVVEPDHLPEDLLRQSYEEFTSSGRCEEYVRKMKAFDPLAYYHAQDPEAFVEKLRRIPVPTTVLWGREDDTSSYDKAMDLLPVFADIELHVLPRASHFVQLDRPREVAALLVEFLTRAR